MAKRFPRHDTHGQRRLTEWGSFEAMIRAVGIGSAGSAGAQATGVTANERLTLVRLRGHGFIHMDAGAALDAIIVGIGLTIVDEEAFAAGVGSLPTPLTDMESDWVWHGVFALGPAVSATDDGGDLSRNVQFEIDSKAMRKIRTDQTLAFVTEGTVVAGTPTYDIFAVARQLYKLT